MYNYVLRLLKEINGNVTLAPPGELRRSKRNYESVTNKQKQTDRQTNRQKNSTSVAVTGVGEI